MYYVYILKSLKDEKLYVGYTSNLRLRLEDHNNGDVKSTKHRKPIKLVYYEAYCDKKSAEKREMKLKQFGSSYYGLIKRLNLRS